MTISRLTQKSNHSHGGGGSTGDPHLKTLDGASYDFQAVGEFTLLKSTTDDFEIQTRQQPWGNRNDVSINTAVAIKLDGQRIAFYLNQPQSLVINGSAITFPDHALYAIGQTLIVREGDRYTITSANNDVIQLRSNSSFIDINLGLADNRQGTVVGLLGNNNDNRTDEFALRDGTVLGSSLTNQQLYGDYANSWRITQADSLFDYTPGTNTTTFTDLTFPSSIVTVATLTSEQRAAAEQIARNAGITDPEILENAILDIALSNGDPQFIQSAVAQQRLVTVTSTNTLINPDGFGTDHWLAASTVIPYTIRFSNTSATGTDPVAQVTITQTLDPDLDLTTFTLNTISFGGNTLNVPSGLQNFSQRLDLRSTRGLFVDVIAGLDRTTGILTWTFTAINPTTGNPVTDPTQGFLPPNDQTGIGQGAVSYSIQPKGNSPASTRIDAQATITFNNNPPQQTAPTFNTLDGNLPTSSVTALPATSNTPTFTVAWTGTDTGSGLATYDIFVSTDGGAFVLWKDDITATSATYSGQIGHSYAFYSVARDKAGNIEAAPTTPDTQITLSPIHLGQDLSGDGKADMIWRNPASGATKLWTFSGGVRRQEINLPPVGQSWQLMGTADLNNDGQGDLIWWNSSTASVGLWQIRNSQVVAKTSLGSTGYRQAPVAGIGDFNGDGTPDLLIRHNGNGKNQIWELNGLSRSRRLSLQGTTDIRWEVQAVGDFNQDGHADIVWQHKTSGRVAIWMIRNSAYDSAVQFAPTTSSQKVQGIGDFNGDGHYDILLRDTQNGNVTIWQMNKTNRTAIVSLTSRLTPDQEIAGIADLNSDRKSDILIRNTTTGANGVWFMKSILPTGTTGKAEILSRQLPTIADTRWQPTA